MFARRGPEPRSQTGGGTHGARGQQHAQAFRSAAAAAPVQEADRLYLVMEYCEGGDLAHFLRAVKRVPEGTARHLMRQLAAGLRQMWTHHLVHVRGAGAESWGQARGRGAERAGHHRRGCSGAAVSSPFPTPPAPSRLQRDLKPQNLLLSAAAPDATLKIADFGFARNLQPQVRGPRRHGPHAPPDWLHAAACRSASACRPLLLPTRLPPAPRTIGPGGDAVRLAPVHGPRNPALSQV